MKLKKYSQYVKEELTPMLGDVENADVEEAPVIAPPKPDTDTPTIPKPWTPIPTKVPSPGTEEQPIGKSTEEEEGSSDVWMGDDLLNKVAEMTGYEVNNGRILIGDKEVSFASETNTFVISTKEKKNRNTGIKDPQQLVEKEFPELISGDSNTLDNKMY